VAAAGEGAPPKVLNLFAYTGASTLAAAAAGAQVVHVDAASGVVEWARRNAAISGLADRPIRWIVEDARKFVQREVRRGNRYDGIILAPPKYGRGPDGQVWRLFEDTPELVGLFDRRFRQRPSGAPLLGRAGVQPHTIVRRDSASLRSGPVPALGVCRRAA